MGETPLPTLLRDALTGLQRSYAEQGAGLGGMPSLDLWANLLRVLDGGGVDQRQLPSLVRLSKRAVRARVSSATRQGWTWESKASSGHTTVGPTAKGCDVAARWGSLQRSAEDNWRARIGAERFDALRSALEVAAAALPLEHPHYPASYGAADASITGGPGQDWAPVLREGAESAAALPLSALISEAWVAFAFDFEELSPVALSLSRTVIRRIPPEGRPVREVGPSVGLSALERHGFVRLSGRKDDAVVGLTARGRAVSEAYEGWLQAVEQAWRDRFGPTPMAALRAALEALPG